LFTTPPASASILAFVTTVHLGLSVVWSNQHLRARRLVIVTSIPLWLSPWLMPSPTGLVTGLGLHALWLVAMSRLSSRRPSAATVVEAKHAVSLAALGSRATSAFVDTTVLSVTKEADDIRTFRLSRPPGVEFVAGQFLPVRLTIAGREHVRCYSISSAPDARGYFEISVKRQGLVSTALHTLIGPGSLVGIRSPAGAFTYPKDGRPLLLIAGGIGITPLLSMLRYAVAREPDRPVTLLYSAPSSSALAFRSEITRLVRCGRRANAIFTVTRGAAEPGVYPGRIDRDLIETAVPDYRNGIALLCGPAPMIAGMRTTLAGMGLPPDQIRAEAFEAAIAIAGGRTPHRAGVSAEAHEIRCARSGKAAHAAAGQTLLEAAEAGGIAIDSLCRSGVCGTCRTRVVEGDVECASMTVGDTDRREGFVLACVTHLYSDCVIEA
jgi:ferredoxin-NADP reductase